MYGSVSKRNIPYPLSKLPPLTSGLVKHYINYKYINTGVNAVSWLHLRPMLPHNDSPRVNDFKNPLETLPMSQVERLLRGPVRRQHVGGLRGLHGRRDGDVWAEESPTRPLQHHQPGHREGISAGLLHRRQYMHSLTKANGTIDTDP